jgi:carbamoyltransferase
MRRRLAREIPGVPILFGEHHESHAASAFYPSPFHDAAVLCMDGVGEWATTSAWLGTGRVLDPLWEIRFPHSIGMLYSAFTAYAGFRVNSGEYKLMGLAPYGNPTYVSKVHRLFDLRSDGSFRLDMSYFDFAAGLRMTSEKFHDLFGGPPRKPENPITQRDMDVARSIQVVLEDIVQALARTLRAETGRDSLCLAGGVAMNGVANGRLLREGPFRRLWIQPAAGDAGGALGAALSVWHRMEGKPRLVDPRDQMHESLLGPAFSNDDIRASLEALGAKFVFVPDEALFGLLAEALARGSVVGWFQGRMEFGPRALGARSILGDPRSPAMQTVMNLKIKYRESFRPFAPSVLAERAGEFFEIDEPSPYMLLTAPVREQKRLPDDPALWGIERLNLPRSDIPAVTHVDYSARIQTVDEQANPRYYRLLKAFERKTGCPVLINTSFNVRGEPIVCTPEDAYRCFMGSGIDLLACENYVLWKTHQRPTNELRYFEPD